MRQQEKRPNKKVLERLAADAALAAGLPDTLDVAVVFLPEKKMAELNWESLRHEGPTDVISFDLRIQEYKISKRPILKQVLDMVEDATRKIKETKGIILHSDQGWQYQNKRYQKLLKEKGIIQSMSRKGNCLDNAVIENFFGLLKSELFYLKKFKSVEDFIKELKSYIKYYNTKRIKIKLKGLSPVEYRTKSQLVA